VRAGGLVGYDVAFTRRRSGVMSSILLSESRFIFPETKEVESAWFAVQITKASQWVSGFLYRLLEFISPRLE
ncbi:MAG: hypothetical protein ACW99J_14290, partial [Candidatus Thorarchaeota archaeon]